MRTSLREQRQGVPAQMGRELFNVNPAHIKGRELGRRLHRVFLTSLCESETDKVAEAQLGWTEGTKLKCRRVKDRVVSFIAFSVWRSPRAKRSYYLIRAAWTAADYRGSGLAYNLIRRLTAEGGKLVWEPPISEQGLGLIKKFCRVKALVSQELPHIETWPMEWLLAA